MFNTFQSLDWNVPYNMRTSHFHVLRELENQDLQDELW